MYLLNYTLSVVPSSEGAELEAANAGRGVEGSTT